MDPGRKSEFATLPGVGWRTRRWLALRAPEVPLADAGRDFASSPRVRGLPSGWARPFPLHPASHSACPWGGGVFVQVCQTLA